MLKTKFMEMKATGSGIGWRRHRECDGLPVSKCQYEETRLDIKLLNIILFTYCQWPVFTKKQMSSLYSITVIYILQFDSLAPFTVNKKIWKLIIIGNYALFFLQNSNYIFSIESIFMHQQYTRFIINWNNGFSVTKYDFNLIKLKR